MIMVLGDATGSRRGAVAASSIVRRDATVRSRRGRIAAASPIPTTGGRRYVQERQRRIRGGLCVPVFGFLAVRFSRRAFTPARPGAGAEPANCFVGSVNASGGSGSGVRPSAVSGHRLSRNDLGGVLGLATCGGSVRKCSIRSPTNISGCPAIEKKVMGSADGPRSARRAVTGGGAARMGGILPAMIVISHLVS